ncbi:MAG: lysylphosphatidylglycerol synthase transmembrane domain-containing protein [Candidatus Dormibacteria bacterium]|jgi:uncharacterized protein (TIRG00374 family)
MSVTALRRHLRPAQLIPIGVGLGAIVALVVVANPAAMGSALSHFALIAIPVALALSAAYYVLQGVRWHLLLHDIGDRLTVWDTILLSVAGQATSLLPFGELTRAIFVSEAAGVDFADAVATVTVQELILMLILILIAIPGALSVHRALAGVIVALFGVLALFAVLLVPSLFHIVHHAVERTPVLRRFTAQVDSFRQETVVLLQRRDTLGWSVISVAGAAAEISLFWVVINGLHPGEISWPMASFVLAASYVGGAISLIPGGIGASEATVVLLLISVGVDPATATAAALLQRVADKGFGTLLGVIAYAVARRRFHLSGLSALRPKPPAAPPPSLEAAGT